MAENGTEIMRFYRVDSEANMILYLPDLPRVAQDLVLTCGHASSMIVALEKDHLYGFFRWIMEEDVLHTLGTWVHTSKRGKGLATNLWSRVIQDEQPRQIVATVVSVGGLGLIVSLKQRHPEIDFQVEQITPASTWTELLNTPEIAPDYSGF